MKKLLNVRVKEETIRQLNAVACALEIPYSQIVREAIKEKTERILRKNPAIRRAVTASLKN